MSDPIDSLPPLRDVIRAHDLRAEKKLGQNFLLDLNLTSKIARGAGDLAGAAVFEIGPGPGGLTRAILGAGAENLTAVEYDPRAIAALQDLQNAAGGRLSILQADALETDILALAAARPTVIIANLPYNIATPLLTGWLAQIYAHPGAFRSMTLMFQKEVAQRIVATPHTKEYGRLSILCQWLCQTRVLFDIPAAAFTPPPKVTSTVVHFVPHPPAADRPTFAAVEKITAAAFGQRRKMIRGSMKEYISILDDEGVDTTLRAENLSVDDYIRIAKKMR